MTMDPGMDPKPVGDGRDGVAICSDSKANHSLSVSYSYLSRVVPMSLVKLLLSQFIQADNKPLRRDFSFSLTVRKPRLL